MQLTSHQIARVLRETEIDSDDEYDVRKRRQLAAAFAFSLRLRGAAYNAFIHEVMR
jgi:hypothetical protein